MARRAGPLNRATYGSCGFESHAFRFWPDGETEIIPRFYRGVPGSNPGRAAGRYGRATPTNLRSVPGDGTRLEAGRAMSLAGSGTDRPQAGLVAAPSADFH